MNTRLSSAQLKSISKGQLLGKYASAISAQLVTSVILFGASMLCTAFADQSTVAGLAILWLISLIIDIIGGIFDVGLTRFYLNLVCNRPYRTSDVFYGFRRHADKAIKVRFLVLMMQLLCMLPCFICSLTYNRIQSSALFLLWSILTVIGCVFATYISLLYSQVYYIMLDFPAHTARQIMSASRSIMKGHKGRLFYIGVSLIPYYLAAFLSCGIALLWVTPYKSVVFTNFYLDLMHREYSA